MNMRANQAWCQLIRDIINQGHGVAPRGHLTQEVLAYRSEVDLRYPLVTVPGRKLGYRFAFAEAAWILSGDNRLETIEPYAKAMREFSDDGVILNGAYGPPLRDQLGFVVNSLLTDQDTRQAVAIIWRPRPGPSKDIPCTVALQWLIRGGKLYCIDTMRSSDAWLGWPYDIFSFSMVTAYIALYLRQRGVKVGLGSITLVGGSQHLYKKNHDQAYAALPTESAGLQYEPLGLAEFISPGDLVQHLWRLARQTHGTQGWLAEEFFQREFEDKA